MSTCQNRLVCPGSDSPYANLSSEANDPPLYIGVNFCWGPGWSGHYPRICFTEGDQDEANLCAETLCFVPVPGHPGSTGFDDPVNPTGANPPSGGGLTVGPPDAPPDDVPAQIPEPPGSDNYTQPVLPVIFWNTAQTCVACCVDGPCETFTMPADKVYGRNQTEADFWAKKFACRAAAQMALLDCPNATCLIIDGETVCLPDIPPPYGPPPEIALYWNGPQRCIATCPDGSTSSYTVLGGRFPGLTQGQADTIANTYACRQAYLNRICLSDLTAKCCADTPSSFTITAFGGRGNVTWAATAGALPPGLSIAVSGRIVTISGTPTTPGDYSFSLTVTDAVANTREKPFTINVMGITNDFALPSGSNNVAYAAQLAADGGIGPYTFEKISGSLPFGVSMDSAGLISGIPQEPNSANFGFTAQVTDSTGRVCTKALNIYIQSGCIIIDSTPLPEFDQGQSYSYQFTAEGGTAPYTFVVTAGTLPAGLSLSSSGLLSGTASLINGNLDKTFTVKATDSALPPVECSASFTLPVVDYHNFPPGKKWRIQGYTNGTLNASCCQVCVLCNVWDGKFTNQVGSAHFKDNGTNGITNHVVSINLRPSLTGPEWALWIYCDTIPGNAVWIGTKAGSNLGAKLDSPAGVYTFNDFFGYTTVCDATPTLTIEEY